MKVTRQNVRVIKTLRWFKEAILKIQPISAQSKASKNGFGLVNGFDGSVLFIEAVTIADAWKTYRDKFKFYDAYIPDQSFLRAKGI